jgi:signal transduction histidine kinase
MADRPALAHDHEFFRYTYAVHWFRLCTNGTIEMCNDAAAMNLGVAATKLVGRPLFDFVTAPDAERIREALRNLGRHAEPMLLNFCDARHSPYTLQCWFDVRPEGAILIGEPPLLEDQNAQRELLRVTQDLAVLARERSRLADAERQARVSAEAADREKDRALAILAHELRQPLGAMRFAAEILSHETSAESRDRTLATLGRQIVQLTRLVEDLLDATRIRENKLLISRAHIDLRTVVGDVAENARPRASADSVSFECLIPSAPIWIHADAARMTQVLSNIVDNALKFTDAGGRVSMTAAVEGRHAAVQVRDTGRGIAAEVLPRVFKLFAQQDDGERGGLGIGMAIAHGIVTLHGGTIDVRSDGVGGGSEFVVRLPISQVEASSA